MHAPPWQRGRSLAATFPLGLRIDLGHGVHIHDQSNAPPPAFAGQRITAYRAYWDALAKPTILSSRIVGYLPVSSQVWKNGDQSM